jgi:hypothetical protein
MQYHQSKGQSSSYSTLPGSRIKYNPLNIFPISFVLLHLLHINLVAIAPPPPLVSSMAATSLIFLELKEVEIIDIVLKSGRMP